MIAIIDSGSTKSDWILMQDAENKESYETIGFNPYHHDAASISRAITEKSGLIQRATEIEELFFYGAGCSSPKMISIVEEGLAAVFPNAKIKVDHDLLACAYATYDGGPSISCILGTGSNSCHFDGEKVTEELPALGYFFGDEGAGSYFGKQLMKDFLYKRLPAEIEKELVQEFGLNTEKILENVYLKPSPNRFLASFMRFISEKRSHPYFQDLLNRGFTEFVQIHVKSYPDHMEVPVHFIGSVAYYFQEELQKVAQATGFRMGKVIQKPIDGLVEYHSRD